MNSFNWKFRRNINASIWENDPNSTKAPFQRQWILKKIRRMSQEGLMANKNQMSLQKSRKLPL
jgi:hypothetical protein